jgi:hypothetical protein
MMSRVFSVQRTVISPLKNKIKLRSFKAKIE